MAHRFLQTVLGLWFFLGPGFFGSPARADTGGFAVLELFTSQGCSSCPPADAVLRRFADAARQESLPVYPLSFHVDYWNYLGWKDPYSNTGATDRQHEYARAFNSSRVYTPQLIVNGEEQFSGADESRAQSAVARATAKAPGTKLEIHATAKDASTLKIAYTIKPPAPGSVLRIAFVEQHKDNKVRRGENAGSTLSHSNVVVGFNTLPLTENPEGTQHLALPEGFSLKEGLVIGFVQDPQSMKISAAHSTRP